MIASMENDDKDDDIYLGGFSMNKKFMVAAALVATTFSVGLAGNIANASQAPTPKAPIVEQHHPDKKDVKDHKGEPQKKVEKEKHQPPQAR